MHREPYPGDGGLQFEPIEEETEIPEPPSGIEPTVAQVRGWLEELERIKNGSDLGEETRSRLKEHMATARLWLGWMESD